MNEHDRVEERLWQHAFEELSGRASPPDRTDEILRRIRARGAHEAEAARPAAVWRKPLLAAALLIAGVTVTVVAGLLERGRRGEVDGPDPGELAVTSALAPQDPKPKPETQLPKGTDPADLAVLRSAEAMIAAEKRLLRLIQEGKIGGVDKVLPFRELWNWKYTEGLRGMPERIRALDGEQVLMLGFMLPIDEVEQMREFLLVASLWSCCYGTPPPVHGVVRCRMPKGKEIDHQFEPVKVVGRFDVDATIEDGYCVDVYQLHVEFLEVIR